jgi:hypothetical protein
MTISDAIFVEPQVPAADSIVAAARAVRDRRPFSFLDGVRWLGCRIGSGARWLFGLISLLVGLSTLAALPVIQLLSLGYLLEAAARVARTGRLRDGFIGVRRAGHMGGMAVGIWISLLLPAWIVQSQAFAAEVIDPGGPIARSWRLRLIVLSSLAMAHVILAAMRGGRIGYFLWPFGNFFWLARRIREGGLYVEVRDRLWTFVVGFRIPYYFRLGLVGFLGTLGWLIIPAILIGATGRFPPLGIAGALLLAVIVPFLPFLQIHYAVDGHVRALFSRRAIRDRFRRAPWAFAFSLMVLLVAAIPLYLLKIEMVPRDAAWLPSLLFVIFLAPARLLTGWAYFRSGRRDVPTHWSVRLLGRIAIVPAAVLYVIVVFFGQYTSWEGVSSLYDQHAFLIPVPFLNM